MNPLFNRFTGLNGQRPLNMMQQFNNFASTFRGDPRQKVNELLSSGQMTQEEFQQYSQMATQLRSMFGKR